MIQKLQTTFLGIPYSLCRHFLLEISTISESWLAQYREKYGINSGNDYCPEGKSRSRSVINSSDEFSKLPVKTVGKKAAGSIESDNAEKQKGGTQKPEFHVKMEEDSREQPFIIRQAD